MDQLFLAVHQLFCVGDRSAEGLADGLMPQADSEDGNLAREMSDDRNTDACVRGSAGAGRMASTASIVPDDSGDSGTQMHRLRPRNT